MGWFGPGTNIPLGWHKFCAITSIETINYGKYQVFTIAGPDSIGRMQWAANIYSGAQNAGFTCFD